MSEQGHVEVTLTLTKPLEKMTAKELRELVIEQVPQITGVSSMGKDEIIAQIKEVFGITDDDENKVNPYKDQILKLKKQIIELRNKKAVVASSEKQQRKILRKKIHNLKKQTRRLSTAG